MPYAEMRECRSSSRYDWRNDARGAAPFVILQRTISGSGMFEINGIGHEVGEGNAFLVVAPEPSRYYYPSHFRKPWVFQWINFYGDFSLQLWREFREQFGPVMPLPKNCPAERMLRELMEVVRQRRHPDPLLMGEMGYQFYLAWWRELQARRSAAYADPILEAEKFCRQHFRRPLAVKEIAAHVEMSREHFTRLFRQRHRMGPAAFLRGLRLREARRLMKDAARLPLSELALRTGFPSPRQLSKYLKRS